MDRYGGTSRTEFIGPLSRARSSKTYTHEVALNILSEIRPQSLGNISSRGWNKLNTEY